MRINTPSKNFTKAERVFARALQDQHIPFRTKVKIQGREIDFLIGQYAIEIDGHAQDETKNYMLIEQGYNPIHFTNKDILTNINSIKQWLDQIYSHDHQ